MRACIGTRGVKNILVAWVVWGIHMQTRDPRKPRRFLKSRAASSLTTSLRPSTSPLFRTSNNTPLPTCWILRSQGFTVSAGGRLGGRYARYKQGTDTFIDWLARAANECCDITRLVRSLAKFNTTRKTVTSSNIELRTVEIVLLAHAIRYAKPSVPIPNRIIRITKQVIVLRQETADDYAAESLKTHKALDEDDFSHQHFIHVLEEVLELLKAAHEAAHGAATGEFVRPDQPQLTKKKGKSRNRKSSSPAKVANQFESLELHIPETAVEQDPSKSPPISPSRRLDLSQVNFKLEKQERDYVFLVLCHLQDLHDVRLQVQQTWLEYSRSEVSFLAASMITETAFGLLRCADDALCVLSPSLDGFEEILRALDLWHISTARSPGMVAFLYNRREDQSGKAKELPSNIVELLCPNAVHLLVSHLEQRDRLSSKDMGQPAKAEFELEGLERAAIMLELKANAFDRGDKTSSDFSAQRKAVQDASNIWVTGLESKLPAHAGVTAFRLKLWRQCYECNACNDYPLAIHAMAHLYKVARRIGLLHGEWQDMDFIIHSQAEKGPLVPKLGANCKIKQYATAFQTAIGINVSFVYRMKKLEAPDVVNRGKPFQMPSSFMRQITENALDSLTQTIPISTGKIIEIMLHKMASREAGQPDTDQLASSSKHSFERESFTPKELLATFKKEFIREEPLLNFDYLEFSRTCQNILKQMVAAGKTQLPEDHPLKDDAEDPMVALYMVGESMEFDYRGSLSPEAFLCKAVVPLQSHITANANNLTKKAFVQSSRRIPKDLRPEVPDSKAEQIKAWRAATDALEAGGTSLGWTGSCMAYYHPKLNEADVDKLLLQLEKEGKMSFPLYMTLVDEAEVKEDKVNGFELRPEAGGSSQEPDTSMYSQQVDGSSARIKQPD